jgi:hypothetical protein
LSSFPPASSASGTTATVLVRVTDPKTNSYRISGELVAVSPSALLLFSAERNRLILIPSTTFSGVNIKNAGEFLTLAAAGGSSRARMSSRFPQGVSLELANRLMDAYGRAMIEITPSGERDLPRERLSEFFPAESRSGGVVRDSFVAAARAGSERFRDRTQAIREGYRRVGPDFPFMGEHWVSPTLVIEGKPNAHKPSVLSYTRLGDSLVLAGVGYAVSGKPPSGFAPTEASWHDHAGTVDDALLVLHNGAGMSQEGEPRFSVLHAWVWASNPDGLFVTDNLALPFVRARLTPPAHIERNAANALSLLSGGADFYTEALSRGAQANEAEAGVIDRAIARTREQVQSWRSRLTVGAQPDAQDLTRLAALWQEMSNELLSALGPAAGGRIRAQLLGAHH